jgi:hypothetical protein
MEGVDDRLEGLTPEPVQFDTIFPTSRREAVPLAVVPAASARQQRQGRENSEKGQEPTVPVDPHLALGRDRSSVICHTSPANSVTHEGVKVLIGQIAIDEWQARETGIRRLGAAVR